MAKLNILTEPNEGLHKRCKEVTVFRERLHQLLDDLKDTMKSASGIGIAAPQVGILYRACLVDTEEGIVELVNPIILKTVGIKVGDEGCLSVPSKRGMVARPTNVTVRAQDRHGKSFEHEFFGRGAVCVSHEIDHLNGVLFLERLVK